MKNKTKFYPEQYSGMSNFKTLLKKCEEAGIEVSELGMLISPGMCEVIDAAKKSEFGYKLIDKFLNETKHHEDDGTQDYDRLIYDCEHLENVGANMCNFNKRVDALREDEKLIEELKELKK